jgi:glutathione S-transferase
MYELHYFNLCPFARSIVLLLNELRIDCKCFEEKNYSNIVLGLSLQEKKNFFESTILKYNNEKISGSQAITEYFAELDENNKNILFGNSVTARARTRSFISWVEHDMFHNIVKIILYEKIFKNYDTNISSHSPDSVLIRETESNLKKYLLHAQSILEDNEYCAGDNVTMADFVLASNISVLDYFNHVVWGMNLKRLKHWYLIIKSRPNFKNILGMRIPGFHSSKQYSCIDF